MERLYTLLAEPIPLRWSQLRTRLPRVIELPDPESSADDEDVLFKRIDRVTPNELQQHLVARTGQLLLDIEHIRLLGELHERAVAAGCDRNAPAFATLDAQGVRP